MGLLALAPLSLFALEQNPLHVRVFILAVVCVVTSSAAFVGWKKSPQGSLRWDGQHWYWTGFAAGSACHLSMLIDFQSVVVVLIKGEAHAPFSLWLEATPNATSWRALRRAIVSSQAAFDSKSKNSEPAAEGELA